MRVLNIADNPLPQEMLAAAAEGTHELLAFLRFIDQEGVELAEVKLILVGEGAVGKSSLLAALRDEPWVEHRDRTHGLQIKPVEVEHAGQAITLNGWDFGGQQVYRPTHQLFFTAPAVYLVVWKPREGPEVGMVEQWLAMIQHRAGADARVHVVATHGGPCLIDRRNPVTRAIWAAYRQLPHSGQQKPRNPVRAAGGDRRNRRRHAALSTVVPGQLAANPRGTGRNG